MFTYNITYIRKVSSGWAIVPLTPKNWVGRELNPYVAKATNPTRKVTCLIGKPGTFLEGGPR